MSHQILVVDDDPEFRQEMGECLEQYRVLEAVDGQQALQILSKPHAIDLILLDVVMPRLSGLDLLKQIKKIAPEIPIIMLTGQSSKDIAIEALKGHADDYIEKPFEVDELLRIVDRILLEKEDLGSGHRNKMERVKIFLERNADKKISLEQAAEEVCLSPKYLSRLFKENVGQGFNQYRLNIKIHKAEELLRGTKLTVEQIAYKLGYKNTESLIRIFEQAKGITPTEFRLKQRDPKGKK